MVGLLIGSFVATIVTRFGSGKSAIGGRSRCDRCGVTIGASRLVPVVSFLQQRGMSPCCRTRIDHVHPLAELLAAGIGAVSALFSFPLALAGAVFGWLLLTLALIDARHFRLPDPIVALLAGTGVAASLALGAPSLVNSLIGLVAGFVALEAVRLLYRRFRGRDGIGRGDPKMFAATGAWLGWEALPGVLLVAALAGLAFALASRVTARQIGWSDRLPLGTLLAIAAWPSWLVWIGYLAR